jgi:hypothetical protein
VQAEAEAADLMAVPLVAVVAVAVEAVDKQVLTVALEQQILEVVVEVLETIQETMLVLAVQVL